MDRLNYGLFQTHTTFVWGSWEHRSDVGRPRRGCLEGELACRQRKIPRRIQLQVRADLLFCLIFCKKFCDSRDRVPRSLVKCWTKLTNWSELRNKERIEYWIEPPPKFWEARSRLYRRRSLQVNTHFSAVFEIYKIYIPLHRSDFKKLAKNCQHLSLERCKGFWILQISQNVSDFLLKFWGLNGAKEC